LHPATRLDDQAGADVSPLGSVFHCYSSRMDKFEFIAILLSIIFSLAIANLLTGMLKAFLSREMTEVRLGWSLTAG
jgi:hypothetical protein